MFAVDRKKIKGATWNYLRENKDYPYYMIKDWIARPEADSVRELKRGDGMSTILLIILILLLIGALPAWPYSSGWGYWPSGGLGLILLIIVILALTGHF